jgi:hypothetical protein
MSSTPTKYRPELDEVAAALYRRGADDQRAAKILGISRRTLGNWARRYPSFAEARRTSKAFADARVESALYRRAIGYRYDEVYREGGEIVKTVTREVVPDLGAQMAWLCNRDPEHWRHVNRVEHTGAGGGPIEVKDARDKLADEIAAVLDEAERAKQD